MRFAARPLGRLPFLALGVGLFLLKLVIDAGIAKAFHVPYSPLFYVSPMDSPLFTPGRAVGYSLVMWAVALPFIAVGVMLTLRRLADAALPPALVALFFVPFANMLFFVTCAVAPSRDQEHLPNGPVSYRWAKPPPPKPRSLVSAAFLSGMFGAVIGLGAVAISVGLLRRYGAGLMLGAPVVSGFASSLMFTRLHGVRPAGALLANMFAFLVSFVVMVAFAIEGFMCLLMALPLLGGSALIGGLVGYAVGRAMIDQAGLQVTAAALMVLPVTLAAEGAAPIPEPDPLPVRTEIIVDAPPEVVWKNVVSFPDLPAPTETLFRMGIAAPLRARIEGTGIGAIRKCEFTTGAFIEPITVWNPGKELSFSVTSQPAPMREMTLWKGVTPPHLDGYLQSVRGQFLLEALPGGKTRLVGTTWYRTHMQPDAYWRVFGDAILHRIHGRVLHHVATLSESEARATHSP